MRVAVSRTWGSVSGTLSSSVWRSRKASVTCAFASARTVSNSPVASGPNWAILSSSSEALTASSTATSADADRRSSSAVGSAASSSAGAGAPGAATPAAWRRRDRSQETPNSAGDDDQADDEHGAEAPTTAARRAGAGGLLAQGVGGRDGGAGPVVVPQRVLGRRTGRLDLGAGQALDRLRGQRVPPCLGGDGQDDVLRSEADLSAVAWAHSTGSAPLKSET